MELLKSSVVFVLLSVLVIHCHSHPMKRSAENEDVKVSNIIDPNSTDKPVSLDCSESADDSSSSSSSDDSDSSNSSDSSDSSDSSVCHEPTTEAPNDEDNAKEDNGEMTNEPTN